MIALLIGGHLTAFLAFLAFAPMLGLALGGAAEQEIPGWAVLLVLGWVVLCIHLWVAVVRALYRYVMGGRRAVFRRR